MGKQSLLTATVFGLLLSIGANAQSKVGVEYFNGKWNLLVKGLPQGDTKMFVNLEKKDSSLVGAVQDSTGKEVSTFSKVDLNDSTITVYFSAQGYDVYLRLDKKTEDHVTGTMMDMFEAEGDRVKLVKWVG